jgi:hypothetical protein
VVELHHVDAAPAPAPGNNFDAAPVPTLLYTVASQLFENKQKLTLGLPILLIIV